MPEVSKTLFSKHGDGMWRSQYGHAPRIGVCKFWLSQRFVLDRKQPLRMVFSTNLTLPDTYTVSLAGRSYYGVPVHRDRVTGECKPHGRPVTTYLSTGLGTFLEVLREKWSQETIAVWFEQDWEE